MFDLGPAIQLSMGVKMSPRVDGEQGGEPGGMVVAVQTETL